MTLLINFIKKILQFRPWQMLAAVILMLFAASSEGVSILLLKPLLELINTGAGHIAASNQYSGFISRLFHPIFSHFTLIEILVLYVGLLSIMAILNYLKNRLNGVLQLDFACDLQQKLYNNFIMSSWQDIANTKRSNFNQLLTHEISQVSFGISMLIQIISTVILTMIYILMAAIISWQLTLIAAGCAVVLYIILHFQNSIAFKLGKKSYEYFQHLYSAINNHLVCAKLAKSYSLEEKLMQQFKKTAQTIVRLGSKFIGVQEANTLLYTIGGAIVFSFIFYFSLNRYHVSIATLFVLLVIFARLAPRVSALQQYGQNLMHTLTSFDAIETMTQQFSKAKKPCLAETKQNIKLEKSIHLENITFAYAKTEKKIFENLNLTIPAKQITAIVGASGAGKSTLIDIIIGLLKPDIGTIYIDDNPLITEASKLSRSWRNLIAYVPQHDYLLNDTIRNNLIWVIDASTNIKDDDINAALQKAGADALIQALPNGLETKIGDDGFSLSGGEKQRLMLARALLRQPALLILDEATNALDKKTEQQILETIYQLREHLTVIIATHHESVLKFADEIFKLH